MKKLLITLFLLLGSFSGNQIQAKDKKFPIGYALDIKKITDEKIKYIKGLGIDYIELAGIGAMLEKNLQETTVDAKWNVRMQEIADILKRHKVKVWSVHMPFSKHLDISRLDEEGRLRVLEAQNNVLKVLKPVKPHIVLFHPSFYLEKNVRDQRAMQLKKSVESLNKSVKALRATMVVENMLGPELTVGDRERPLMRTVEEAQMLFKTFPKDVGIAVDFCHIARPENLLAAFGSRVKTLHVSNGNGKAEDHLLPCDPRGSNDWNAIFATLERIKYKGVYMHECKFNDEEEIVECYNTLWNNYQTSKKSKH